MPASRFRCACALWLALLGQTGCSAFDGLTEREGACRSAAVPASPTFGASLGSIEFTVAVKRVDLGDVDDGTATQRFRKMGYDIDGTCTAKGGQASSCIRPAWATSDDSDGPGGRDNGFGALVYTSGGGAASNQVNSDIEKGVITTLIRVRGYNGGSTDNQVEVAIYGATMNPTGSESPRPAWQGDDKWKAHAPWVVLDESDAGSNPSPESARFSDPNAYVTNGILVAKFESFLLGGLQSVHDLVVTARIVEGEQGANWSLRDGTFSSRFAMDDILSALDFVRDNDTNQPLCTDAPNYPTFKQNICATADINALGVDDGSAPCDAASWAWQFSAEPALLEGVDFTVVRHNCMDNVSPSHDHCDTLK